MRNLDTEPTYLTILLYHIRHNVYCTQHSAWHVVSIKNGAILIVYLCSLSDYELLEDKDAILLSIFIAWHITVAE